MNKLASLAFFSQGGTKLGRADGNGAGSAQ